MICSWLALDKPMQAGGPDKSELIGYLYLVCRFAFLRSILHLLEKLGAIFNLLLIAID